MELEKPATLDILPAGAPALSSTSDMPVVETKPDAEAPAAPEPEVEAEGETEVESATTPEAEPSASDMAPKAKGVQKRLAELVRQREDAERRASEEREEKLRLLALIEESRKPAPKVEAKPDEEPEPAKPRQDDFPDPKSWEEAVMAYADKRSEWAARKAVQAATVEAGRQREQDEIAAGIKRTQEQFSERLTKTKEKYTDFSEVVEKSNVMVPQIAVQAIVNHPLGPELQYYLGKNPDEAQRLTAINNPLLQAMELGSIIGKLDTPQATKPTVSNAPPPIKPIKSSGETPSKNPEEESMEEYAARRKQEMRGGRDMRH